MKLARFTELESSIVYQTTRIVLLRGYAGDDNEESDDEDVFTESYKERFKSSFRHCAFWFIKELKQEHDDVPTIMDHALQYYKSGGIQKMLR